MKLYSASSLPPGIVVRHVFDLIDHTGIVSLRRRTPKSINEESEGVRRAFVERAPKEANAIIGVQISTSAVLHDIGGGGEFFLTYCGNPAIIDEA